MSDADRSAVAHWDRLHAQARFRPRYPNDHVVRFVMANVPEDARRSAHAIDIGVGGGRHTHFLCELGFRVAGVDISAEGLRHCSAWLTSAGFAADLRAASMTALPFADSTFALAVAFGVFYYGDESAMDNAIAEMYRVLEPGGRALVIVRTTADYRFGKGDCLGRNTFRLTISDTNEEGALMHFLDEDEVRHRFAAFSDIAFERTETTFRDRSATNSDWIVQLRK